MLTKGEAKGFTFDKLEWDTQFFGKNSAKAALHKPLSFEEWSQLEIRFEEYEFLSIVNLNSDPTNARLIGTKTLAYLVDTNIQFEKVIAPKNQMPEEIVVQNNFNWNDNILKLTNFKYSRFIEDPELEKRKGNVVYREWLNNAFDKEDKYFAVSYEVNSKEIKGYALFSYSEEECLIELIAVAPKFDKQGIGSRLFMAVEAEAAKNKCIKIRVGTQLRNLSAINFYHKLGCKQTGCHQVYHLWIK